VGGNWKSNNTLQKSLETVESVVNKLNFNPANVGKLNNYKDKMSWLLLCSFICRK
jgi:hypothetical protein